MHFWVCCWYNLFGTVEILFTTKLIKIILFPCLVYHCVGIWRVCDHHNVRFSVIWNRALNTWVQTKSIRTEVKRYFSH